MIVVSDASPLIALLNVGRIDLLRDLYDTILVPPAVAEEVLAGDPPAGFPPDWIEVRAPGIEAPAETAGLGAGETAALTLSVEIAAEIVVIDERRGRAVARALGLTAVGLLKVVLDAKAAGLIPSVQPVLAELGDADFRISDDLRAEVLRRAGEQAPP